MAEVRLTGAAIDEFFKQVREKRVVEGHRWLTPARLRWLTYCFNCGLVWAKNKATQKEISRGCVSYVSY